MEQSILTSTKQILGLDEGYTAFDLDICTHINAAFSVLHDLGLDPAGGFTVQDKSTLWEEYPVNLDQLNMIKSYVWLKVRNLFDTPTSSFAIDAAKEQIAEFEWRIAHKREMLLPPLEEEVP